MMDLVCSTVEDSNMIRFTSSYCFLFKQKLALDKLLVRLHRMYDAVGKVTQATIDPLPKDKKMETVMGKIDGELC